MRTSIEAHAVLRACAQELDPHTMKIALYGHLRGGLPTSSMSDGRGTAEPPHPELDEHDRELLATLTEYEQLFDDLATRALRIRKIQRDLLYRRPNPIPKTIVLAALDQEPDPRHDRYDWCTSCLRIKGHLCPIADAKRGGKHGTLCRWCIDHRDGDKWPPLEHVRAHAEGRPVRLKTRT